MNKQGCEDRQPLSPKNEAGGGKDDYSNEAAAWLLKPLNLEGKLGFRNTAVAGGLESWVPRVREKLVLQAGIPQIRAAQLLAPLDGYGRASTESRAEKIAEVRKRLEALGGTNKPASGAQRGLNPSPCPHENGTVVRKASAPRPKEHKKEVNHAGPADTPAGPLKLDTPVQYLRGVGPARGRVLAGVGVETAEDLLRYFPRDWQDRRTLARIGDLQPGLPATVTGTVKLRATQYLRRGLNLTKVVVDDGTGLLTATWFNQPFMKERFKDGQRVLLYGKVEHYRGFQIANPDYEIFENEEDERIHTGRIVPVYPLTERLSQRVLRTILFTLLSRLPEVVPEFLPEAVVAERGFPTPVEALRQIHFPDDLESLARARSRLIFEELFLQQVAMQRLKHRYRRETGRPLTTNGPLLTQFDAALPFPLTGAQQRARAEILGDLAQARPMHRLLQGDVGSGKTIVAALALLAATDTGLQAALMAPTEILAIQHYLTLKGLLTPCGVTVELFTSGIPARERKALNRRLAAGEIQIAVGTHALTQDKTEFKALGLAVVDEQHRFGVEQRALLRAKGDQPHVLVMTATPIPRTLALTAFGDLDVTTLDELPPGRRPVVTEWLQHGVQRAYRRALEEIRGGRQAYVIFPLVEESEKLELKAVTAEYERLTRDVFAGCRVGLMHGRLPTPEKEAVMAAFKAGELDVLAATTVIEVGVDVPNATVMIIENAERFGLAQLHQLRGRIGRGVRGGECYLIGDPHTEEGEARLACMAKISDGFRLAEEDLAQRGPGEFFGLRQHGMPDLKLADLIRDAQEIEKARKIAVEVLRSDPELNAADHDNLRQMYQRIYSEREKRLLSG